MNIRFGFGLVLIVGYAVGNWSSAQARDQHDWTQDTEVVAFDLVDTESTINLDEQDVSASWPKSHSMEVSAYEASRRRTIARREIAYQVLNIIDAAQTIDCLNRQVCKEVNPLLGSNPDHKTVIGFKALTGIGHYLLLQRLREKNPAIVDAFQWLSIGVMGGVVAWNLKVTFKAS